MLGARRPPRDFDFPSISNSPEPGTSRPDSPATTSLNDGEDGSGSGVELPLGVGAEEEVEIEEGFVGVTSQVHDGVGAGEHVAEEFVEVQPAQATTPGRRGGTRTPRTVKGRGTKRSAPGS